MSLYMILHDKNCDEIIDTSMTFTESANILFAAKEWKWRLIVSVSFFISFSFFFLMSLYDSAAQDWGEFSFDFQSQTENKGKSSAIL